jgi:hypothetical protein
VLAIGRCRYFGSLKPISRFYKNKNKTEVQSRKPQKTRTDIFFKTKELKNMGDICTRGFAK